MSWNSLSNPSPATSSSATPKAKGNRANIIIWTLIVLAIIASIAAFVMMRSRPNPTTNAVTAVTKPIPTATNKVVRVTHPPRRDVTAKNTKNLSTVTNEVAEVATNTVEAVTTKSEKKKITPTFSSTTEMILARIFSTRLGDPPPMVPAIPPRELKDLEKILNRETPIRAEDSETMVEMKKTADLAKEELYKFLEKGGDDSEFINYYTAKLQNYHEQWKDAQRLLVETAKEGDYEVTKQLMNQINEKLSARGIKNVRLPPKFRKELEQLERERKDK